MNKQDGTQTSTLQRPTSNNRDEWKNYWKVQGKPWRTEPEIDTERQKYLAEQRRIEPLEQGIYPFKGIKLNRADVEWLLATHENGRGPVEWSDPGQHDRTGLDLRGADLTGVDLSWLPLAGIIGGLTLEAWRNATFAEREAAAVRLSEAYMLETHLEGAILRSAHLERSYLRKAHLEDSYLRYARFEGASLRYAHLEGADIGGAFFDVSSQLDNATFADIQGNGLRLGGVHWEGVDLSGIEWKEVKLLGDELKVNKPTDEGDSIENTGENVQDKQLKRYKEAVRAYRQLAVDLQSQGIGDEAARFAYRGQILRRQVLLREKKFLALLFSFILAGFAGYGYKPGRFFLAALTIVASFWAIYIGLEILTSEHLSILTILNALIFSVQNLFVPDFGSAGTSLLNLFGAIEGLFGIFILALLTSIVTNRILNK